jgi:cytochrome c-type biogenesis protein CcmH
MRRFALACVALLSFGVLAKKAAPAAPAASRARAAAPAASAAPAPSSAPAASGAPMGEPRGGPLAGPALEARTEEIASLLRCPVCQGLSVADSPATMARAMKVQVREKLAAGYDQDQILDDFERSYGEFVRLKPVLHGVNWLVWGGPVLALLLGGLMVVFTLRHARRAAVATESPGLPSREALPDDRRLAQAVLRVRELAYGWPGGIPPGSRS